MPEPKTIAIVAASLVVGVMVAPPLRVALAWFLKASANLLLLAAAIALVLLLVNPDALRRLTPQPAPTGRAAPSDSPPPASEATPTSTQTGSRRAEWWE